MRKIATREAYGAALARIGQENRRIVVLDADLSKSTKTCDFAAVCPERFINMGIAEANMMGVAAGLAASGKIPVASSFAMFAAGRAFEIIRNSIAYPKLNVKICATHAGVTVGEDGASHQAVEDVALMRAVPGMTVVVPADDVSTEKLFEALIGYEGPVYFRLGRAAVPTLYEADQAFQLGKAQVVRAGTDYTVIANGIMVWEAVQAHDILAEQGISLRVIDMHTVKPIDREAVIAAARETKGIVTAEEHTILGGLGGAVAEVLCEAHPTKLLRVGVQDTFGESGKPGELMVKYGLTAADIVKAVQAL